MRDAMGTKGIDDVLGFARYLAWADLVREAHEVEFKTRNDSDPAHEVWGPEFAWMSYWYSSLFVVIEAYESIGDRDPVVEALLSHPGRYKDLLRRYRNGIFHYQADLTDSRLLDFLKTGEEHVYWVYALHDEFKRLLREWIDSLSTSAEVRAEVRRTIHQLTAWLPDERARRDLELTLGRSHVLVSRPPNCASATPS